MMEFRDWFIIAVLIGIGLIASAYLFLHPDIGAFAAWCTLHGTLIGAYHWFVYLDSKRPDA